MSQNSASPWLRALGISDPDPYEPEAAWARTPGGGRITAPLGHQYTHPSPLPPSRLLRIRTLVWHRLFGAPAKPDPSVASVDLARHRIGVIQGGAGSAAPRLLRHLITGLCARYGPDRLSLLLVDFRGGELFSGIAEFPHSRLPLASAGDAAALEEALAHLKKEAARRRRLSPENLSKQPRLVVVVNGLARLGTDQARWAKSLETVFMPSRDLRMTLLLVTDSGPTKASPLVGASDFAVYLSSDNPADRQSLSGHPTLRTGKLSESPSVTSFVEFSDERSRAVLEERVRDAAPVSPGVRARR